MYSAENYGVEPNIQHNNTLCRVESCLCVHFLVTVSQMIATIWHLNQLKKLFAVVHDEEYTQELWWEFCNIMHKDLMIISMMSVSLLM